MKIAPVLLGAILAGSASVSGQGFFVFNNRVGTEVNARFVPASDSPGTSSVGNQFQVQLFGGPQGAPLSTLEPLMPPSTTFRGEAGSNAAGYVVGITPVVPGVLPIEWATVLLRVFDGPSWEAASYRFEGAYDIQVIGGLPPPPVLPLGTSPLVLQPIPELSTLLLALVSLAALGGVRAFGPGRGWCCDVVGQCRSPGGKVPT